MILVISLDGLHPNQFSRLPSLDGLIERGAFADRVIPVYPTVTFSNHVTMITGVSPARHGIYGNMTFLPEDPLREEWCFDYACIRAPTLWDAAARQGKTVAVIRWPLARGAKTRWLVPELFNWADTMAATDPQLAEELRVATGIDRAEKHHEFDEWVTRVVEFLASGRSREGRPDILFAHLVELDHVQHETGPGSAETLTVLARIDHQVRRIVDAMDPNEDQVLFIGDHGFHDLRRRVHLNGAFLQKGWISVPPGGGPASWKVVAHQNCGQASIHLRDPRMAGEVLRFLRENARDIYRVLDRQELDRYETLTDAFCAVECFPGYSLGDKLGGPLVTELLELRGEHGYLPDDPAMHGSIVALGAGIQGSLGRHTKMLDIAPVLARLLGIEFPVDAAKELAS